MTVATPSQRFDAPWSRALKTLSAMATFTIGVPALYQFFNGRLVMSGVLFALLALPMALTVRRYEVVPHELRIRRLFWDTRWPLYGLTTATVQPYAMSQSMRTWGIGGVFSVSGHFVNFPLGRYRAFVTDPARTVILRLTKGVLVVSPDRPEDFVAAITSAAAKGSQRP